jgi:transposase
MPNRRNVMRANDSGSLVHLFGGERAGVDQGIPYPRHADAGMGSDCGAAGEPAPGIDSTPAPGDEVLSIEDLARRFNVSTKTISRWRSHGLVAQRYVVDGRRRVGFLASTVDRFMHDNPLRIERGAKFSQLSGDEHDKIMGWAKRLAVAGACPADVHRRIAQRLGRSVETIRYTIKRHDQEHPDAPGSISTTCAARRWTRSPGATTAPRRASTG